MPWLPNLLPLQRPLLGGLARIKAGCQKAGRSTLNEGSPAAKRHNSNLPTVTSLLTVRSQKGVGRLSEGRLTASCRLPVGRQAAHGRPSGGRPLTYVLYTMFT